MCLSSPQLDVDCLLFRIRLPLVISGCFVLCHIFSVYLPTVEINVEVIEENRPEEEPEEEDEAGHGLQCGLQCCLGQERSESRRGLGEAEQGKQPGQEEI